MADIVLVIEVFFISFEPKISRKFERKSRTAQETNRMLDKIRVGINKSYQEICDHDNYVTTEKVRNIFLGMGMNHGTLLAIFRQHNEDYAKQVGKIKSERVKKVSSAEKALYDSKGEI